MTVPYRGRANRKRNGYGTLNTHWRTGCSGNTSLVGEDESADPAIVHNLDRSAFIPVIAPIGSDREGNTCNINADTSAEKLAVVLDAEKRILLTNAPSVLMRRNS